MEIKCNESKKAICFFGIFIAAKLLDIPLFRDGGYKIKAYNT